MSDEPALDARSSACLPPNPRIWSMLDEAPVMAAYVSADLIYLYSNEPYAEWVGIQAERLVGRNVREVARVPLGEIETKLLEALKGERRQLSSSFTGADGVARWLEVTYLPDFDSNGHVLGVFAFVVDIGEQKALQDLHGRLLYAFDQGSEGFALHDEGGRFIYANPAQAQMYGYTPAEIVGRSWKMLYEPAEVARIEDEAFPKLMQEGRWRGEVKGRRKDGTFIDIEVSLTPLVDGDGKPNGLVCNCQDITERKLSEAAFRQLQKMDALGQLTGGIAHDVNNLLAVIVGNLELMREKCSPELQKMVERALEAADSGSNLTRRLLAFARKQPLQPEVLDLHVLMSRMQDIFAHTLGDTIQIDVVHQPGLGRCVADRSQLENALLNLAINARDAMPDGGTVRIELRNGDGTQAGAERADEYLRISVSDTGVGMGPDVRERMFDPFFTTKSAQKGSGLGLSMVHGFVNQSGGRVDVDSELGRGTCVTLVLPRHLGAVEDEVEDLEECPRGSGQVVLVVEDRPEVLSVMAKMVEELGYRPLLASDGQSAMAVLEQGEPVDLVLSDVVLPGTLRGPDLIRAIRSARPEIRGLLMSGYPAGGTLPDVPLLPKPVTRKTLGQALSKALG